MIYVQEAHPNDGWQTKSNLDPNILFRHHQSFNEREKLAGAFSLDMGITIPILLEEMDNAVDEAYGASPERLYLVGANGDVAYQGGAGPYYFDPEELERAIVAWLAGRSRPNVSR